MTSRPKKNADAAIAVPDIAAGPAPRPDRRPGIAALLLGGLALGVMAGTLLPRRKPRPKTAAENVAALVGELSATIAAQALGRAQRAGALAGAGAGRATTLGRALGQSLTTHSLDAREQAARLAERATDQIHRHGRSLAKIAIRLIERRRS
ncbi:MAG: hypothetical protein KGK11_10380 [Sphingomonadales bacterium]|nr:hypothetical protein [Sphingomonadales bacterium]